MSQRERARDSKAEARPVVKMNRVQRKPKRRPRNKNDGKKKNALPGSLKEKKDDWPIMPGQSERPISGGGRRGPRDKNRIYGGEGPGLCTILKEGKVSKIHIKDITGKRKRAKIIKLRHPKGVSQKGARKKTLPLLLNMPKGRRERKTNSLIEVK